MKIFNTEQIRAWDAYTIQNEPVGSVELMNRAARVFTDWFTGLYSDPERLVCVIAGTGNNGGDGVAVARLLHRQFYAVKVFVCEFSGKHSSDFDEQVLALSPHDAVDVQWLAPGAAWPPIPQGALVIDALFGSGLTRPLEGEWARAIEWLNSLPNEIVSIDLPSGLFADRPSTGPCVRATRTFSFETPKLAFFFPENAQRVGEWACGSIGLHPDFDRQTETPWQYLTETDARALIRPRSRFSHKGTFGHALLVNGSTGKTGAAVLAARACLRAGAGLVTVQVPKSAYAILQTAVPEAMCSVDAGTDFWTELPNLTPYASVGVGCGIGDAPKTAQVLKQLLQRVQVPIVLDADALNLLARHPNWFSFLPKNALVTPHPKEFERMFGSSPDGFARNAHLRAKAQELGVYIILKGAFTAIACPDGTCWFNSSGNPGMATGGSGDVLTGVLTALLAQGYPPRAAALLGVFGHGLAGDLAAADLGAPGMTAGDLALYLGTAWKRLA